MMAGKKLGSKMREEKPSGALLITFSADAARKSRNKTGKY